MNLREFASIYVNNAPMTFRHFWFPALLIFGTFDFRQFWFSAIITIACGISKYSPLFFDFFAKPVILNILLLQIIFSFRKKNRLKTGISEQSTQKSSKRIVSHLGVYSILNQHAMISTGFLHDFQSKSPSWFPWSHQNAHKHNARTRITRTRINIGAWQRHLLGKKCAEKKYAEKKCTGKKCAGKNAKIPHQTPKLVQLNWFS